MPYITDKDKALLVKYQPNTAGELNYSITLLLIQYLKTKGENYQTYNDIMGALEGAKLEAYRRKVAPYEDTKIILNGEVYK